MPFLGELKYEKIKDKESFVGRPVFKLTQDFGYFLNNKVLYVRIECKKGFETDFASIPEWVFFIRPRNGKWAKASVIHDKACILASNGELSYKDADLLFYYAMREDNASWFTANFFYFLVTVNHIVAGKD
jgi:hypothetical protein